MNVLPDLAWYLPVHCFPLVAAGIIPLLGATMFTTMTILLWLHA